MTRDSRVVSELKISNLDIPTWRAALVVSPGSLPIRLSCSLCYLPFHLSQDSGASKASHFWGRILACMKAFCVASKFSIEKYPSVIINPHPVPTELLIYHGTLVLFFQGNQTMCWKWENRKKAKNKNSACFRGIKGCC